jgi:hypothetical protein
MAALPEDASLTVSRIEAMLDEADRLIERTGAADESAFSLKETGRRYLPDTLNAYLNVPPSQRDAAADALLVDQLRLLERATAARLAALPEVPQGATPATLGPPRALVARLFADLQAPGRTDPGQLLELAGRRFAAVFPNLTTVRRGLFGGGPPKSVALDVPRGADVLRYVLEADRAGVAASCTKVVRGVALRTERIDIGEWMRALLEDLSAYVERDRASRELLTAFLSG